MSDEQPHLPVAYDAEKRIVRYANGGEREEYFIGRAVRDYKRYGKPALLLWAIDNQLPGLTENAEFLAVMRHLVEHGKPRGRGKRTSGNLEADQLHAQVVHRVWYHIGRGYPAYNNPDSGAKGVTACELAAEELGKSAAHIHKVWQRMGGREPKGPALIAARVAEAAGKAAVDTK